MRDSTETATSSKRPLSSRAHIISAACACVAVLGVVFALYKYIDDRDMEKERQTERAIAHLYPLENGLSRYLADNVDMHVCLDDDPDGSLWLNQMPNERIQFRAVCAMVADELEYYLLIRDNILTHPRGHDIVKAWDNNLKGYCRNSYGFRAFIKREPRVWTDMFLDIFKEHTKDLPSTEEDKLGSTKPPSNKLK